MKSWSFTDMEFVAHFEMLDQEWLPIPFVYSARIALDADHEREMQRISERLRAAADPDTDGMLQTLLHPDIKIEVECWNLLEVDKPDGALRLLAARKGDKGFLVKQLPGETIWHSGGFTVTEHSAVAIGEAVAQALPERKPGSLPSTILSREKAKVPEYDYAYGSSSVRHADEAHDGDRAKRFLEMAADCEGSIEVIQGESRFGPRGITKREILLRDVIDDGRYLITPGPPKTAVPTERKDITSLINTEIATIVAAIKDERL